MSWICGDGPCWDHVHIPSRLQAPLDLPGSPASPRTVKQTIPPGFADCASARLRVPLATMDLEKRVYSHSLRVTLLRFVIALLLVLVIGRICFALELVNEGCCLAQPFEPLLGRKPVKFSVTVEIFGRALSECALEF